MAGLTRVAFDSNVLVYLTGTHFAASDADKTELIKSIVARLDASVELVAPVQVLGELFVVLRRGGIAREEAAHTVAEYAASFACVGSQPTTLAAALDLATNHKLQFWDSIILAASAEAGCSLLVSEDMQDGFQISGLTVVNPFAAKPHEKLARLLA